jgi:hypothetical protein
MAARRYANPNDSFLMAGIAALVALAGMGYLRLPAVGVYLAVAAVTAMWVKPELLEPETPQFHTATRMQAYKRQFLQPFGLKTLLGPAGGRGQDASATPPLRLSGILAVLIAAAVGTIEMAFLPWEMLAPAGDAAATFLLVQALAAGARDATDPSPTESFPAAMLDHELLGAMPLSAAATSVVIGAVSGGAIYAALNFAEIQTGVAVTTNAIAVGVIVGAVAAIGAWSRIYITDFNEALREHLARAEAWAERWMAVPRLSVGPPQFRNEREQPPAGRGEETHRIAHFQAPAGATIEDYRAKTSQLSSAIGQSTGETPEVILISPVRKTDAAGKLVPGSRQEGRFSVSWSTVDLPARPHLTTDLDNWTAAFVITAAFDKAFRDLKLGLPDLSRVGRLYVDGTHQPLYETVWTLTESMTFDKVAKQATAIADRIGAPWLRVGRRTRDATGKPVPDSAVTIIYGAHPDDVTLKDPTLRPILDAMDVEAAFHSLGLGSPLLEDSMQLSLPGNPELMEARFRLADGSDWTAVAKKTSALQEKINVPYLRMTRRLQPDGQPSPLVSVIYGCHPSDTALVSDPPGFDPAKPEPGEERNADRLWLDGIDWDLWMRQCKLTGTDGRSPTVIAKTTNDQGVATYRFRAVPGLAGENVDKEIEQLKATSAFGYLEVRADPDDAGCFQLLAARIDPLDKPYLAVNYVDEVKPGAPNNWTVLHEPVRGQPDIDWVVGVGADGKLLVDKWEGDNPHLFIGGASGSGKSITLLWGILQMLHNNDPEDLHVYMADPKTELSYFEDAAHVKRFIGLTTPGFAENPYLCLGDMLEELRKETYRRNTLMVEHPAKPQKLSAARFVGVNEVAHAKAGTKPDYWPDHRPFPWWDGDRHPFDLPFVVAFVEECSTFFKAPSIKEQRPDWERLIGTLEELARIARSAGVFMVALTQYPKKENISTTFLAQTRRIGLAMNRIGSMLTIEEPGLETIDVPGRGKMSQGKNFVGMRCHFVRAPDEKNPDTPDDREQFYASVPKTVAARGMSPGQPRLSGPTAMADAPPAPDGLWVAHGGSRPGDHGVMTTVRSAPVAAPSPRPPAIPTGGFVTPPPLPPDPPAAIEANDQAGEDVPDLDDLLAMFTEE